MRKLRLEILALANYADFSKDNKLSITGIFDQIYSEKFPSSFLRAFIAMTVTGSEPAKNLMLDLEIIDSSGKKIVDKPNLSLNIGNNGKGNFIVGLVGVPLPMAGVYTVLVKYNKEELGKTEFEVIKVGKGDARPESGRSIN